MGRPVKITDSAPSTVTYGYDAAKEPRDLPITMTDSAAGTFTATYGPDGEVENETLPGGYSLTTSTDEAGFPTSRVYTRDSDGLTLLSDIAVGSIYDQTISTTRSAGATNEQNYTYDRIGRLTQAAEEGTYNAQSRSYTFDDNSNRTQLVTKEEQPDGTTVQQTTNSTYDSADRLTGTGISYDDFGRTLTQPGSTFTYYTNDLIHSQTSGDQKQTWNLDAENRLASWTTETAGTSETPATTLTAVNHYGANTDSPTWTVEDTATGLRTRNVRALSDSLAAVTGITDRVVLELTDLHGDAGIALPLDTSLAPTVADTDEYGNTRAGTETARYNWLAAYQRSSQTPTGLILMGQRLYDPAAGRFLTTDPVDGGNANAYEYCSGDSVNCTDLSGQYGANRWGCGAFVDRPHQSGTPGHTHKINVHADLKCKTKVPRYSIRVSLYRSRWWGWEKIGSTGYVSGANRYKDRAVANWAPHGHCYYYKAVGEFMIHGGHTTIRSTVYNYDTHFIQGKKEMCVK
ncbi:RHS repeat-associated core domain-containing protein [Streptomyces sp. NPDC088725]|uniref:RHS repeat-associated core domain-containing protein n=1 Tax=Streptomyces sp. NPDC088725 TaxID=3365873 RepID=UPI00381BC396